jgi:hypothetical protein
VRVGHSPAYDPIAARRLITNPFPAMLKNAPISTPATALHIIVPLERVQEDSTLDLEV